MKKEIFYYAIVCEEAGICGAFVSRFEAQKYSLETDLQLCSAKHKILRCEIKLIKKNGR